MWVDITNLLCTSSSRVQTKPSMIKTLLLVGTDKTKNQNGHMLLGCHDYQAWHIYNHLSSYLFQLKNHPGYTGTAKCSHAPKQSYIHTIQVFVCNFYSTQFLVQPYSHSSSSNFYKDRQTLTKSKPSMRSFHPLFPCLP